MLFDSNNINCSAIACLSRFRRVIVLDFMRVSRRGRTTIAVQKQLCDEDWVVLALIGLANMMGLVNLQNINVRLVSRGVVVWWY